MNPPESVTPPHGASQGHLPVSGHSVDPSKAPEACGCWTCDQTWRRTQPWPAIVLGGMILCPLCGNKRCPRAAHHDNGCTRSNEPGQPGSGY